MSRPCNHPAPRPAPASRGFARLLFSWCTALVALCAASVAHAIDVYPANTTIEQGASRQYMAYVPMTPNTVDWLVNDVVGGNATVGTISATGAYVAPANVPTPNTIVIKARSTANPSSFGSVSLAITRKVPAVWNVSPASISVGAYQVAVNGAYFAPDSQVLVNGTPVTTTFSSSTRLLASGNAAAVGTVQFAVRQPGAGSVTSTNVAVNVTAVPIVVSVTPNNPSVQLGATQQFSAAVSGTSNTAVNWLVATGGGSIDATGRYTAPAQMPSSTAVTIRATSVASPNSSATVALTLVAPPPPPIGLSVSPTTASVLLGATQTFTTTLTNTSNTAVTWTVPAGGGSINAATGVYTAPANMPASSTVTLTARSVANQNASAVVTVTLRPPPPATVSLAAARFLEQSSFGPTPATLAEVTQKGIPTYLAEQFALPETPIFTPPDNSIGALRQWCLYNYTTAPDQLRQRVAFALSQIIVVSGNKNVYSDQVLPWLRLLSKHAFGNYRDLLREVTVSPSMGFYLDLAFSAKPTPNSAANENYAREIMQLFTIGLYELNMDGSHYRPNGVSINSYTQDTVAQMSLALTGWVYANNAFTDFSAPMVAVQSRHSTVAKTILGVNFAANQTVEQELEQVLDVLMTHRNTAPFIATRLIRSLVKSNPSPAYIERVANVFANNGQGVRGDLKAVVTAILLDAEARNDTPDANSGRLKDAILQSCGFLRALGGNFTAENGLAYLYDYVAQGVLTPNSVFSWFSPLYRLPSDTSLFAPEFQIYSPTDSSLRGNYLYHVLHQPGNDASINLAPFQPYGNDMVGLVEAANQALLYGRMPPEIRSRIETAAGAGATPQTRIETALYLTALTGQYAVQH